jgi:hypothetical protein
MSDTTTPAAPSAGLTSLIVNPAATSITLRDGELVEGRKQESSYSLNTADSTKGDGVSLLSTAKTQAGSPTMNMTKDTLVNYQGMDITLQNAERLGLVKQVDGQYVEVPTGEQSKATEEAPEQDLGESLGNDMEAELSALSEVIPPALQTSIIESVLRKGLDATNINDMTHELGTNTEELRGRLGTVETAFREQADKALMTAGMGKEDIPAFVKWAQEKHKGAFDDACRNHVYNRSTKGYADLAKAWMNTTAPSAASLPASVNPRTVRGETLVTIPGHPEMSLQVATRLGLI